MEKAFDVGMDGSAKNYRNKAQAKGEDDAMVHYVSIIFPRSLTYMYVP